MRDEPDVRTGTLQTEHWDVSFVAEGDRVWRLELTGRHPTNLGRRITLEETRADFDLHDIQLADRGNR